MAKIRKLCSYPMSLFYVYEDEVPPNIRVSTEEDCKNCECIIDAADCPYCLIED